MPARNHPPIVPPDLHYLNAAVGWIELGNPAEAEAELEHLSAGAREHPDVLELRWDMLARRFDWNDALAVARRLLEKAPERASGWIHRSFSLHELKRTQEAWEQLLPAVEQFPKQSTIPYNLACYACQLSLLDEARAWLDRALRVGGRERVLNMALADRDLEPLWPEIERRRKKA